MRNSIKFLIVGLSFFTCTLLFKYLINEITNSLDISFDNIFVFIAVFLVFVVYLFIFLNIFYKKLNFFKNKQPLVASAPSLVSLLLITFKLFSKFNFVLFVKHIFFTIFSRVYKPLTTLNLLKKKLMIRWAPVSMRYPYSRKIK